MLILYHLKKKMPLDYFFPADIEPWQYAVLQRQGTGHSRLETAAKYRCENILREHSKFQNTFKNKINRSMKIFCQSPGTCSFSNSSFKAEQQTATSQLPHGFTLPVFCFDLFCFEWSCIVFHVNLRGKLGKTAGETFKKEQWMAHSLEVSLWLRVPSFFGKEIVCI